MVALAMVALAMVALLSAGCANAQAGTGTGSNTGSSGGNTTAATHQQAVRFAACMRANGVRGFPDPDASGTFTIEGVANGSSLDPSSAAFERASAACKDLEPPGLTGHKRSVQEQAAALKFARCIRDNGVRDFPDPTEDAPLVDTERIPSAATQGGMSNLHAAMQKCRDLAANAGVTGGK